MKKTNIWENGKYQILHYRNTFTDKQEGYGKEKGYYGFFKEGKRNGIGKDASYEGQWKDDNHNGYGIKKWPNGIRYYGKWKDFCANGEGAVVDNGEIIGEGKFVNGWMNHRSKYETLTLKMDILASREITIKENIKKMLNLRGQEKYYIGMD